MATVAFLKTQGNGMSMNALMSFGKQILQNNTLYIKKKCCIHQNSKASKNLKAEAKPKLDLVIWLN